MNNDKECLVPCKFKIYTSYSLNGAMLIHPYP